MGPPEIRVKKGPLILVLLAVGLGGYVTYDVMSEKKAEETKAETSRLFKLEPEQVNEFSLERPGGKLTKLTRDQNGWKLVDPIQDWADSAYTDDFVARVLKEKSTDIAKEGASIDWKLYGLDVPLGKITFKNQAGVTEMLEVGTIQNFEGSSLGRRPGGNQVLVITPGWQGDIQKEALDFRDKRFFRGKIGGVDQIEVKNPAETFQLASKDGKWMAPAHPGLALDQNRVRELLSAVNETKAADFLLERAPTAGDRKKFEIEKPAVRVTFKSADKTWTGELALNKKKELIAVTSESPFVLKMESGQYDKFATMSLGSLRDKKLPFAFDKTIVTKVDLRSALKKARFEKKDGKWALIDGAADQVADDRRVQDLIDRVREGAAVAYKGTAAARELDAPSSPRLQLIDKDGKVVFELKWSLASKKEVVDGQPKTVYLARSNQSKENFWLEETSLSSWNLGTLTRRKDAPPPGAPVAKAPADDGGVPEVPAEVKE